VAAAGAGVDTASTVLGRRNAVVMADAFAAADRLVAAHALALLAPTRRAAPRLWRRTRLPVWQGRSEHITGAALPFGRCCRAGGVLSSATQRRQRRRCHAERWVNGGSPTGLQGRLVPYSHCRALSLKQFCYMFSPRGERGQLGYVCVHTCATGERGGGDTRCVCSRLATKRITALH
jgi:hypothetical protein